MSIYFNKSCEEHMAQAIKNFEKFEANGQQKPYYVASVTMYDSEDGDQYIIDGESGFDFKPTDEQILKVAEYDYLDFYEGTGDEVSKEQRIQELIDSYIIIKRSDFIKTGD